MSASMEGRLRTLVLLVAPIVLVAAFAYHPYVGSLLDSDLIAEKAADDADRWAMSHVVLAISVGLVIVALLSIRHQLRAHGDERWSFISVPLAVFGLAVIGSTAGMEITLAAAINAGADPVAIVDAAEPWAGGIYAIGGIALSLGLLGLAIGTYRAMPLGGQLDRIAAGAFVVVAVANFVPHSIAEYVIGAAIVVALWPFAYREWEEEASPAMETGMSRA
jgi:hypothetical protein